MHLKFVCERILHIKNDCNYFQLKEIFGFHTINRKCLYANLISRSINPGLTNLISLSTLSERRPSSRSHKRNPVKCDVSSFHYTYELSGVFLKHYLLCLLILSGRALKASCGVVTLLSTTVCCLSNNCCSCVQNTNYF